jgi:hypothetical protein
MSGGSAASETITIVQDAQGRPLAKAYRFDAGRVVRSNYPNASEFRAVEVEVDGIASLAAVLEAVAADGHEAVIRGAPGRFYPRDGSPAFRLLRPQEGLVAARTGARISNYSIRKYNLQPDLDSRWAVTWLPTFEDCPRAWAIFDVDRIPAPAHLAGDWVDVPEEAVAHVRDLLPEPFQTATCWWSLSASAAVPDPSGRVVSGTFKLKLAFWLDRPLNGAELKRWMSAENAPVDPAVFGAVQLIYLARPGFGHGLHDPVPRRTGMLQGEVEAVEVPEFLPEPDSSDARRAEGFEPAEGLEELVGQIRARLQGALHVREHLMAAARSYIRQHGPEIDQAALIAALEGVAREFRTPSEIAGYGVDRMVEHVVKQERAATWMPFNRPPPPARLPPYFGEEAANLFREVNRQRHFLRDWLQRNFLYAIARHEIAARRAAAFAEAGLA